MLIISGKKGRFLGCSGYPECENTKPLGRVAPEPTDEKCEKCESPMVIRSGRRGRFMACSAYPKCKNARPLPRESREESE
jgi:DNA topoisomerase-1